MSSPFLGEIRLFPYNFAPYQWAFCQGQLLPISQNPALFSLLGTFYGGNGTSNFALPNLAGSVAVGQGQLSGGNLYVLGEQTGVDQVTLVSTEIPQHTHQAQGSIDAANDTNVPSGNTTLGLSAPDPVYDKVLDPLLQFSPKAISLAGGSQPHENRQPYLALNYCIALAGIYPPRT